MAPPKSSRTAWMISAGLHAALLLAAVFIVPFGELTGAKPRTPRTASAEQVRHVTDQVRAAQEIEVRANLERIAEIEEDMRQLLEPKLGAYEAMERGLRESALADALAAQEQTLARQRETLEFLRKVKAEPIAQYGRGGDANGVQAEADAAQDAAVRATGLLDERFAAAAEVQRAAKAAQAAAGQALVRANDQRFVTIQQRLSALSEDEGRQRSDQRHIDDRAKWEKDWPEELVKTEAMHNAREAKVKAAEAALTEAQAKLEEAKAAARAKKEAADRIPDAEKDAKQQAKRQAESKVGQARDRVNGAKHEAKWSRGQVESQRDRWQKLQAELRTYRERMAAREKEMAERRKVLESETKDLVQRLDDEKKQAEALAAQERANALLKELAASGTPSAPAEPAGDTGSPAGEGATAVDEQLSIEEAVRRQRLVRDAAIAARTENRRLGLADLYEQAKQREREASGKFHDFKSTDVALQRQVTLDEARKSVDLTNPQRPEFDRGLLTEQISDPERLARARDEMAAVTNEVYAIRSRAENLLASMLPPPEEYAVVPPEMLEIPKDQPPPPEVLHNEVSKLKLDQYTVDSGRRVEADGLPADFLAVTSWYVIGPYPNPQRRNIDRVFPPEQMLVQQNLDDVYDDGAGRPLRWQFHQEGGPKLTPPNEQEYAIYYAYTELWSDIARPVKFYVGSDDKGKIWLNGEVVYTSDNRLLGWMPDRGVVDVTLQPGANRILFRVENGWKGCNWSLLVRDPTPPPAMPARK